MVGGDDQRAARPADRLAEPAETGVDRLDRAHRRRKLARVADHVGAGVVDDDQVEAAAVDGLDQFVGHLEGRHLGFQVVGGDLGRRHQDAFLAREQRLLAAVEEECHVGVLLGLGDAQLRHARGGGDLAEGPGQPHRREQRREEGAELIGVLGHAARGGEAHHGAPLERVERGVEKRGEQLAHAVGAEVAHQDPVAVLHAGVIADRGGQHELVGLAARIGRGDRGVGVGRRFASGRNQRLVGLGDALPAPVAVHRVIAPADRGDGEAPGAGDGRLEVRQVAAAARRRGVAAVEKGVHRDLDAAPGQGAAERRDMVLVAVHAAGRNQPHQVARAAAVLEPRDQLIEHGVGGERAVGDRPADARQVLGHDAPGAEVHVADLGVAHLPGRQPDAAVRRREQAVRARRDQPVPNRRARLCDGVVLAFGAITPAVEHAQHDGAKTAVRHHAAPIYQQALTNGSGEGVGGRARSWARSWAEGRLRRATRRPEPSSWVAAPPTSSRGCRRNGSPGGTAGR